jgi:hypothetical protein
MTETGLHTCAIIPLLLEGTMAMSVSCWLVSTLQFWPVFRTNFFRAWIPLLWPACWTEAKEEWQVDLVVVVVVDPGVEVVINLQAALLHLRTPISKIIRLLFLQPFRTL